MIETFIQSHNGEIHLLPALPSDLPAGSFNGFRARGKIIFFNQWPWFVTLNRRIRGGCNLG